MTTPSDEAMKEWFRTYFEKDFTASLEEVPDDSSYDIPSWANGYTTAYMHLRDKILTTPASDAPPLPSTNDGLYDEYKDDEVPVFFKGHGMVWLSSQK